MSNLEQDCTHIFKYSKKFNKHDTSVSYFSSAENYARSIYKIKQKENQPPKQLGNAEVGQWVEISEATNKTLHGYRTLKGDSSYRFWRGKVYYLESDGAVAGVQFYPYTLIQVKRVERYQFIKQQDYVGFAKILEKFITPDHPRVDVPLPVAKLILSYVVIFKGKTDKKVKRALKYSKWYFSSKEECLAIGQVATSRLRVLTPPINKVGFFRLYQWPDFVVDLVYEYLEVFWPDDIDDRNIKFWASYARIGGRINLPPMLRKVEPYVECKGLHPEVQQNARAWLKETENKFTKKVKMKIKKCHEQNRLRD